MRYKIQVLDSLGGWIVVITDYTTLGRFGSPQVSSFYLEPDVIKVADLPHMLGDLHRQVAEVAP